MSAPIGSGDEPEAIYGDEVYADGVEDTEEMNESEALLPGYQDETLDTSYSPPERRPQGSRYGTTALEEFEGESLDQRLAEEEPDVSEAPLDDEAPRAGRLVAPDQGIGPDDEKDVVAQDVGLAGAASSAEEAAIHVVDEDDAGLTDEGGSYGDDDPVGR